MLTPTGIPTKGTIERLINGRAAPEALMDGPIGQSQVSRPRGQRLRDAPILNQAITPHVQHLDRLGRPAAIARLVMAVVIDAVNRVLGTGPRAHIAQECLERTSPCGSDADAAATVTGVVARLRVLAAFDDVPPRRKFWRDDPVDRVSVRPIHDPDAFRAQAPAGLRMPAAQIAVLNQAFCPAVTATEPPSMAVRPWPALVADDDKAPVAGSDRWRVIDVVH